MTARDGTGSRASAQIMPRAPLPSRSSAEGSPRHAHQNLARSSFFSRVIVFVAFVAASLAPFACTPVPIVDHNVPSDAAVEGGDGATTKSGPAGDGGDAEAGSPPLRKEWDAGVDDDAFPSAADGELELRMKHLLEAIAAGDPSLGPDLLYPRDAWVRAHDAKDPGKAWDHKIKPSFLRDIAKLHKRTKGMERAKFVSFELGHGIAHVQVKAHDLKKPVWRVRRSRLTYSIDDKTKHLDISEMTSFRGAWYVTKLR